MGETKQINIKNRTYYFYNDIIDLKDFDAKLLKTEKKLYKNIANRKFKKKGMPAMQCGEEPSECDNLLEEITEISKDSDEEYSNHAQHQKENENRGTTK